MDALTMANAELSKFSRNYMELKKDLPIRPSEMGVLNIIAETQGPHTPLMLADMLGVSKAMIAAHIASLAKAGYITKQISPSDKRSYSIQPTEKGWALIRDAKQKTQEQLEMLIGAMGQEPFGELIQLITQANRQLEKMRG